MIILNQVLRIFSGKKKKEKACASNKTPKHKCAIPPSGVVDTSEKSSDAESENEQENDMPSVKFYGLSTCIHCKKAKEFLDNCGIDYEHTLVDTLEGDEKKDCIEIVKQLNPRLSFPTICIGDKVVVGFDEKELKEALGQ